jgi:hypothetical protein
MMPDEYDVKHAPLERADDDPALPRRRPGQVRQIHNAGGLPDVFAEGEAARDVRRGKRPTPDLSAYRGHERVGVPSLEDDDLGGDA